LSEKDTSKDYVRHYPEGGMRAVLNTLTRVSALVRNTQIPLYKHLIYQGYQKIQKQRNSASPMPKIRTIRLLSLPDSSA
jgi:hypothetical protein